MGGGQTILVLGSGFGGLVAAVELRKQLPKKHRVVLIDRSERHLFTPSLLWVISGARRGEQISRPLERLKRKGIEVVRGEIERINPAARQCVVNGAVLEGDYLIIALGADLAPQTIPGLPESGHTFYNLAGAEALQAALGRFEGGRLVLLTAAPAYKCPAAPYEAAMLLEHHFRKRGLRERVKMDFYAAEPGPMGVAGPAVMQAVRQMVESKGIAYHPEHQVTAADPGAHRLTFANGNTVEFDLLAHVPPHRVPHVLQQSGLVGESGWVAVDRHTLATKFDRVFAVGDVVSIPLKLGKPLPKAGVFAHGEAQVVARNIALAVTGKGEAATFDGHGGCFIETGDGKAGFGAGDFYAEPLPDVRLRSVGRSWHFGKILFEKSWLYRWF
jgi:sulfide:quinone oxidoreductase